MNRSHLQDLSRIRIRESRVLLDAGCFEGAYYLAGYAVECALKSCIARQTRKYDFPDRTRVKRIYTHDLEQLLDVSELKDEHQRRLSSDAAFAVNWSVVKDWNESSRYRSSIPETQARDLYSAVTARKHGVLPWLRKRW